MSYGWLWHCLTHRQPKPPSFQQTTAAKLASGRCINLFQNSGFLREGIAGPGGLQRGQKKGEHCGFFYGKNDDINWYDITHWIWGFSGKQCSDKCRQIQRCIFLGTQSLLFPRKFSASGDVTMDWAEEKFTAENVTILPSKSRGSSNCSLKRNMGSTEPDNKRQWVFFLCWDRYMIKIQNPWVRICYILMF